MAPVQRLVDQLDDLVVTTEALAHPRSLEFKPTPAVRAQMAKTLGLIALPHFSADLSLTPWLDGVTIQGRWRGQVVQTCGVSLEDFATDLTGDFEVRALPAESPHRPEVSKEVVVEADGEDPPDVLEKDALDLGGYVLEHLSLEVDPFPRKPGAQFEPPPEEQIVSPFAALRDKIV